MLSDPNILPNTMKPSLKTYAKSALISTLHSSKTNFNIIFTHVSPFLTPFSSRHYGRKLYSDLGFRSLPAWTPHLFRWQHTLQIQMRSNEGCHSNARSHKSSVKYTQHGETFQIKTNYLTDTYIMTSAIFLYGECNVWEIRRSVLVSC